MAVCAISQGKNSRQPSPPMEIDVTPNPASGRLSCRSLWAGEGSGFDYYRPSPSTRPADFVPEQPRGLTQEIAHNLAERFGLFHKRIVAAALEND
jgi:hypothetical protein